MEEDSLDTGNIETITSEIPEEYKVRDDTDGSFVDIRNVVYDIREVVSNMKKRIENGEIPSTPDIRIY